MKVYYWPNGQQAQDSIQQSEIVPGSGEYEFAFRF